VATVGFAAAGFVAAGFVVAGFAAAGLVAAGFVGVGLAAAGFSVGLFVAAGVGVVDVAGPETCAAPSDTCADDALPSLLAAGAVTAPVTSPAVAAIAAATEIIPRESPERGVAATACLPCSIYPPVARPLIQQVITQRGAPTSS